MSLETRTDLMNRARQSLAEGRTALEQIAALRTAKTLTPERERELLDTHDRAAEAAQQFKRNADSLARQATAEREMAALADVVEPAHPTGESAPGADLESALASLPPEARALLQPHLRGAQLPNNFAVGARAPWDPRYEPPDPSTSADQRSVMPKEARAAFFRYLRMRREAGLSEVEQRALSSYTDPEGGYIAVHELINRVIEQTRNLVQIERYATVIPTQATAVSFPTFKSNTKQEKVRQNQKMVLKSLRDILGRTTFVPNTFGVIIKVPRELVDDTTFPLLNFLGRNIALDSGELKEEQYLSGSGSNEPLGALRAPIPSVSITGATIDIKPEDIIGLPYELRAAFRIGATWMLNRRGIQKVRRMRDDSGFTPGTGQFLWQIGMQAGEPDRLAGYPVMESEFFPNAFDAGTGAAGQPVALFADWKEYWIIQRLALAVERLNELYAETSEIGFQYRMRYDAAPVRLEAFVRLNRN